jgi:hypothetical protein
MTVALKFGRDANSFNAYAPKPSDIKYSATLAVGVSTSITLPGTDEIYCVSFRYQPGSSVFVDVTGTTAAVPAGGTLASTTSELNPASLTLNAGDDISMITDYDVAQVSVVVWRIA